MIKSKEINNNFRDDDGNITTSCDYSDSSNDMDVIETTRILENYSDSDTIVMSDDEIKQWKLESHPYFNLI
jgi:hypothetical protein